MPRSLPLCSLFLLIVALLSGCASQPLPAINNWDSYQARLGQLQQWQLNGKLGVRLPSGTNDSRTKGGSAYLDWQQTPTDYVIRLSGPLGQGTTWIRGNGTRVSLEQSSGEHLSATTPEELVYQTLGWELPIRDLFYWVRGIPAPRTPISHQQLTSSGSLSQLQQSGWVLAFSRYTAIGPWQLPGKIIAEHNDVRLTLVIKDWRL